MIDKYTAQAPTIDQAIEKGLQALGIKKDEASIEVSTPGKKGFLGIGRKDAVVTVKRKETSSVVEDVFAENPLKKEDLFDTSFKEEKQENEEASVASLSTESKEDFVEAEKEEKEEVDVEEAAEEKTNSINKQGEETAEEHFSKELDKTSLSSTPKGSATEQPEQKDQEGIKKVKEYIYSIVENMGIKDAAVYVSREGKKVQYDIETEDAGLIIGRHGKVLNGLQTLAQTALHQQTKSKLYAKVDAENYRNRRKKTVEKLAKRTADKANKTNLPVFLEPMPAHERKQIHRYLNKYSNVKTHSEGKEPHRYLVVEPGEK